MAPQLEMVDVDIEMDEPEPVMAPPEESAFTRFRRFRKGVRVRRHRQAKSLHGKAAMFVVVAAACYFAYLGQMPTFHGYHGAFADPHTGHARLLSSDLSCKAPLGLHTEYPTGALGIGNETYAATLTAAQIETKQAKYKNASGMAVLYLLLCLYIFIGIGIVCDFFFEPSLEAISEALDLSPDVAGATFMAAGSSAPELFTSVGDTFGTGNNIGIGTIVGSAMFNILIIIAVSAMYAGQTLDIEWAPVARDVGFYSASVGMLVVFFLSDNFIEWWEGMIMVLGYGVYIVYMVFNAKIQAKCVKPIPKKQTKSFQRSMTRQIKRDNKDSKPEDAKKNSKVFSRQSSRAKVMMKRQDKENQKHAKVAPADPNLIQVAEADDEEESLWEWPESTSGRVMFILSLPFNAMFTVTIPNCAVYKKLYPVTFVMCIVWLAVLCFFMAQLGTGIGCIWAVDPLVMGILLLAIGTSVPDAMASMIVAREGEGGMAIANAIGSNVFDILLGLGLPWMFYGLLDCDPDGSLGKKNRPAYTDGDGVFHASEPIGKCVIFRAMEGNLYLDLAILYGTVFLFVAAMIYNKWKMNNTLAWMLIILYIVYITFQIIMQM